MKVTAALIARAVVETARMLPPEEYAALGDAAASLLESHGLLRERRTFLALVDRLWHKQEGVVAVTLTSPSGDAGPVKKQLLSVVEAALKRRCVLEERADPSILGGLSLIVGDDRFDCTVRSSLNELSARLTAPIPIPS